MIHTETIVVNGKEYTRAWSDLGVMIERDGTRYEEAIDPAEFGRTYTETDELIETDEPIEEVR